MLWARLILLVDLLYVTTVEEIGDTGVGVPGVDGTTVVGCRDPVLGNMFFTAISRVGSKLWGKCKWCMKSRGLPHAVRGVRWADKWVPSDRGRFLPVTQSMGKGGRAVDTTNNVVV